MKTQTTWQPLKVLVALALCMALQMTGFVMILPLFARRFESFGAGVDALGISIMTYALTSSGGAARAMYAVVGEIRQPRCMVCVLMGRPMHSWAAQRN